jgi:FMN phosphatase YigB (HAD superfamily)
MPELKGIDTILFDLDGTLLNVDMHQFILRLMHRVSAAA